MKRKELRPSIAVAAALATVSLTTLPAHAGDVTKTGDQAAELTYRVKATDLIGRKVTNMNGNEVGRIDDLMVTRNGRIAFAIVSVGGILGIGDKLVAVKYDQFRLRGEKVIVLDVTKASLEKEPAFTYREDRDSYKARGKERVEVWEERVGAWKEGAAKKGKEIKKESAEKVDAAWAEVKAGWKKLEKATAETREEAEAGFEKAWKNFEAAWADATS